MDPYVKTEIIDGVGEIEFFHPKSNSLPSKMLKELAKSITDFGNRKSIKCIILKSAGERVFCAGAFFDELVEIDNEVDGYEFFSGFSNVIRAIKNAPKFVVALVQGKVVGGGVGIVSASDYVIASPNASCKLSELSIGIGPFVIAPVVERKIGLAHFINMSLNPNEWKSAEWALDKGLFSEVSEDFNVRVKELVRSYLTYSPEAMNEIKSMFWEKFIDLDREMDIRAKLSGRLVISDFTKKKLGVFKL